MKQQANPKPRRSAQEIDAMISGMLMAADGPITAYSIVRQSRDRGISLFPTQVYRSLERLVCQGKIERIVSLNAFIQTQDRHLIHLLCSACGSHDAAKAHDTHAGLIQICSSIGFEPRAVHVELPGRCHQCALDS